MTRFSIWAAPLLVVATPAFAQEAGTDTVTAPVAAQVPAVPAAAPVKPKKVCRTMQITGRRISQSQCYTAAQWAEYDRASNEAAKKLINDVSSGGSRTNISNDSNGALNSSTMFGIGPPQ
jgi:hypothetical protein